MRRFLLSGMFRLISCCTLWDGKPNNNNVYHKGTRSTVDQAGSYRIHPRVNMVNTGQISRSYESHPDKGVLDHAALLIDPLWRRHELDHTKPKYPIRSICAKELSCTQIPTGTCVKCLDLIDPTRTNIC